MYNKIFKRLLALTVTVILSLSLASCAAKSEEKPLVCMSIADGSNNSSSVVVDTLTNRLQEYGYRVYTLSCSTVAEQSQQIMNFITQKAAIIIIDCAGESEIYTELFYRASEQGCKVAVLNGGENDDNCAVRVVSFSVLEGALMCDMVKKYLDKNYINAEPDSVKVTLLATVENDEHAKAYAGYCLISEKYLRYFSFTSLSYIREDTGEQAYCRDAYGNVLPVDEPAGGLVLDEDGYAILNPYYDERVSLDIYSSLNLHTVLDGQNAVDTMVTKNKEVNVIIAMNGNVAIGAAERIQYYKNMQIIDLPSAKLAVFGEGDTSYNRELVMKSAHGESLLRGFVGRYKIEWAADAIINALLYGKESQLLRFDSICSVMTPNKNTVGITTTRTLYGNVFDYPDVIFTYEK
jgi:ABC-type sugar transport system substrate-binding protein